MTLSLLILSEKWIGAKFIKWLLIKWLEFGFYFLALPQKVTKRLVLGNSTTLKRTTLKFQNSLRSDTWNFYAYLSLRVPVWNFLRDGFRFKEALSLLITNFYGAFRFTNWNSLPPKVGSSNSQFVRRFISSKFT